MKQVLAVDVSRQSDLLSTEAARRQSDANSLLPKLAFLDLDDQSFWHGLEPPQ